MLSLLMRPAYRTMDFKPSIWLLLLPPGHAPPDLVLEHGYRVFILYQARLLPQLQKPLKTSDWKTPSITLRGPRFNLGKLTVTEYIGAFLVICFLSARWWGP